MEPSVERVDAVQKQLLKLGNAEGKMKAFESESSSEAGKDNQLTDLLKTSQQVFHQTFEEYIRIWKAVPLRAESEEVLQLWQNSLLQCRSYLEAPLPFTREQLIEDSTLCSVHQNILIGQSDSLATLVNKRPTDFQTVETLYNEIETELTERQSIISARLQTWNSYKRSQDGLSQWLQHMEKEKRALELPFLDLKRLSNAKSQIKVRIVKCFSDEIAQF